jgi:hypothetical protein
MKFYPESQEEPGVIYISIRLRPKRLGAVALVLLLHGLFLYLLLSVSTNKKNSKPAGGPMVMIMEKLKQIKKGEPEPKKAAPKQSKAISRQTLPVMLADEPRDLPPPPPKIEEPIPDMASMLNAARERRQKAEAVAASENQAAQQGNRGLSPQEVAEANVRRSLERANGKDGDGGLFTVTSKGVRVATFSFRGWDPRSRGARQVFEVDAGLGGNVELAIVKRMIEVIRLRFKTKAPWESQRLGRVVMISMAIEDTEEVERFLMKEVFESDHPKR